MTTNRRGRIRHTLMSVLVVLLAGGVSMGAWALNRFVIDHVEISDVRAYEAAMTATPTATDPAAPSAPAMPTTVAGPTSSAKPTKQATPVASASRSTVAKPRATSAATPSRRPAAQPSRSAMATASASGRATPTPTPSGPVITADSYRGTGIQLSIRKVAGPSGDAWLTYYVADLVLEDVTSLRSAFAKNKFGTNIIDLPSVIAQQNGGFWAVNGDYYGFRDTGIEVRNGVAFRDAGIRRGLAIYRDGSVRTYDETKVSAQELVDAGVWHTMSFGPVLVEDGKVPAGIDAFEVDTNFGNHPIQGRHPRTAFGYLGKNHFIFVTVDGRQPGYSDGLTMPDLAKLMQGLGCRIAYNLDGGGSTTMWFNGGLVNRPSTGTERGSSDILYLVG